MGRKRTKRWTVETWLHKGSGQELWVCYDKGRQEFWSQVGPVEVDAETQEEAKQLVNEAAKEHLVTEEGWNRVMLISIVAPATTYRSNAEEQIGRHTSPVVGFHLARFWVRKTSDGVRYTRDWARVSLGECEAIEHHQYYRHTTDHGKRQSSLQDVQRVYASIIGGDAVEMPYSEALWNRLLEFSEQLKIIRKNLQEVIQTDDFAERMLAQASLFAALPEHEEEGL